MRALATLSTIALLALPRPALAQRVIVQVDGTVNTGYTQITQEKFQADPMAEPGDIPDSSTGGFFTELRPGVSFQGGSPRLLWTLGYQFSANLVFGDSQSTAYTNTANAALAALLSKYTQATLSTSVAQGGTSFLLGQRAAEEGQPEIRAPGNPSTLSVNLAQSLIWEVGKRVNLRQGANAGASAPDNDFGAYSASVTGTLGIDRLFTRDTAGLEVRVSLAQLQSLDAGVGRYVSLTNAALLRWNHDFSYRWNLLATAGVEQLYIDDKSKPLGLFPTGTAFARYTDGNFLGGVEIGHGSATNLQVGAVSLTDRITARGAYTLSAEKLRTLSASAGFLHNQPLGETSQASAAVSGDALQIDAGFTTALSKLLFLTARYSLAYQYGQSGGIQPSLAHIASVGVTARYSTADKPVRPQRLRLGGRVDGADGPLFPEPAAAPPSQAP